MTFEYRPNNVHISLFHVVSTWENKCELLCFEVNVDIKVI